MAIFEKVIPPLASLAGVVSILLALISLLLSFIDYAASLFAFLGIPFALLSLFSKQGATWIKIFGVLFIISFSTYSFRSLFEQNGQVINFRKE
ncbi:hypothetical protein [Methyloprofundus sp.]|uniref:hypothetical protein n=1 Tax=Methyloprofundus sp. TaxID=2020875 RepID=UPI003D09714D